MADVKDMYYAVKAVNKSRRTVVDNRAVDLAAASNYIALLLKNDPKLKRRKLDIYQANLPVISAVKKGYLVPIGKDNNIMLELSETGWHLIAKKWGIPVGLIEESLKIYSKSWTIIGGAIVGGIIGYIFK